MRSTASTHPMSFSCVILATWVMSAVGRQTTAGIKPTVGDAHGWCPCGRPPSLDQLAPGRKPSMRLRTDDDRRLGPDERRRAGAARALAVPLRAFGRPSLAAAPCGALQLPASIFDVRDIAPKGACRLSVVAFFGRAWQALDQEGAPSGCCTDHGLSSSRRAAGTFGTPHPAS